MARRQTPGGDRAEPSGGRSAADVSVERPAAGPDAAPPRRRRRQIVQAAATAAVLLALAIGVYFGYYFAVICPEMRRLAAEVSLEPDPPIESGVIRPPTGRADAGPAYQRALESAQGPERFALDELVAVSSRVVPARADIRVDLASLAALREAAACAQATIPGAPLDRLLRRADLVGGPSPTDPPAVIGRLARALVAAAMVHQAAGRDDRADTDFRAAYHVGCHLVKSACDVEMRQEGVTVCRMATAGLQGLALQREDADLAPRLRFHLRVLALAADDLDERSRRVSSGRPLYLEAMIAVASRHPEAVWRREAALGLVRLTRVQTAETWWAWLIRRRARAVLRRLADDPDFVTAALARRALGLAAPTTRP